MKTLFVSLILLATLSFAQEESFQDVTPSQFRISLGYGIGVMNPTDLNDHIATENTQMSSTAKSVKSMPEMSAAMIFSPEETGMLLAVRGGYLATSREFLFEIPETNGNSDSVIARSQGSNTEKYSAYPFSFGVGFSNKKQTAQVLFEFIYGLGYITQDASYTLADGTRRTFTTSLFSPTYGFRGAVNLNVPITKKIGLGLEFGYRYLNFDQFENDVTAQSSPMTMDMSGILIGGRLNIDL
jgi:hypothetical protein